MPAQLLVIGLDGTNATLLERWADRGHLPNIAALRERAAAVRFRAGCMETLPGAIWVDIASGLSAFRHGCFYHFKQYRAAEGTTRAWREDEFDAAKTFWGQAAQAGRRCAVVDVPFMPIAQEFNGIQLREFAVHDLFYGASSAPPSVLGDYLARHPLPPLSAHLCDEEVNRSGRDGLIADLAARGEAKAQLTTGILNRENWDLFLTVLGEGHCAGHYLWPQRDRHGTLRSPVAGLDDPWEALRRVYTGIDRSVGRLIAAAGQAAQIVLFTSHSMGTYLGGPQLIPEALRRLHLSHGWDWPGRQQLRAGAYRLRQKVPLRSIENTPAIGNGIAAHLRDAVGASPQPELSAGCKAISLMNNRIGAIRFLIEGRDKNGSVAPHQVDDLRQTITGALHALVEPQSGQPIVHSVTPIAALCGGDAAPDLPDLIVKFRTDLGPLTECRSARLGTIRVPIERPGYTRSGDHVPQSHGWIVAPGYDPGGSRIEADILDIAPAILDLLGLIPGADMEGVPLSRRRDAPAEQTPPASEPPPHSS